MQRESTINYWLDDLLARGAYGFAAETLRMERPAYSDMAVKRALSRLSAKGRIVSLHRGYYLLLPPTYVSKGMLPPQLFLDAFMNHLQRPYYLALLNAAAHHGASHQQPQEYFVMTDFPVLRPTQKKGLKINYISIRHIPPSLIEKRKTEAGYMNISNAALTAGDLVQFEKRVGGINRAATVLNELAEAIKPTDFSSVLLSHVHVTALQRLGFILEHVCFNRELSDALYEAMIRHNLNMFRIPLKAAKESLGFASGNRWKVIANVDIDLDE